MDSEIKHCNGEDGGKRPTEAELLRQLDEANRWADGPRMRRVPTSDFTNSNLDNKRGEEIVCVSPGFFNSNGYPCDIAPNNMPATSGIETATLACEANYALTIGLSAIRYAIKQRMRNNIAAW